MADASLRDARYRGDLERSGGRGWLACEPGVMGAAGGLPGAVAGGRRLVSYQLREMCVIKVDEHRLAVNDCMHGSTPSMRTPAMSAVR